MNSELRIKSFNVYLWNRRTSNELIRVFVHSWCLVLAPAEYILGTSKLVESTDIGILYAQINSRDYSSIYTRTPENVENIWYLPILCYSHIAFTHLCSCLASSLARTFVCLCLCAKKLFSHVYEHSHVRTYNANRHSSPLTRVRKTASRASATNGKANDTMDDEANMWLVRSSFASPLARMCKCGIRELTNVRIRLKCVKFFKFPDEAPKTLTSIFSEWVFQFSNFKGP